MNRKRYWPSREAGRSSGLLDQVASIARLGLRHSNGELIDGAGCLGRGVSRVCHLGNTSNHHLYIPATPSPDSGLNAPTF